MSSFLFGEIIEPSTRALIDEDLEEYPEYLEISPEWEGNTMVPNEINSLFILESKIIKDLIINCVFPETSICKLLNGGIEIHKLEQNDYLVLYVEEKELNPSQVVEVIQNWIHAAKHICTITSDSIHNYQNIHLVEKPNSLVRVLTNSENTFNYEKLEEPNLVTGLSANILSFCIHQSLKKCTLFVIYWDNSPSYSYNSGTVLDVFKKVGLPVKNCNIKISASSNNLYM